MTLKQDRADLTDLLAAGLSASAPKLGAQVNPPAVLVSSGTPYVVALDYCTDAVLFAATLVSKPGDPPAVVDALDDMIDLVRSTLRGSRFRFIEISGFIDVPIGEEQSLPAVVISIGMERFSP